MWRFAPDIKISIKKPKDFPKKIAENRPAKQVFKASARDKPRNFLIANGQKRNLTNQ